MLAEVSDLDKIFSVNELIFLFVIISIGYLKLTIDYKVKVVLLLVLVYHQMFYKVFLIEFSSGALSDDHSFRAIQENLPKLGQVKQDLL